MHILAPCNQRIDAFYRFRSVSCLVLFHYRRPCPVKSESHLTGDPANQILYTLCVLCASNDPREGGGNGRCKSVQVEIFEKSANRPNRSEINPSKESRLLRIFVSLLMTITPSKKASTGSRSLAISRSARSKCPLSR